MSFYICLSVCRYLEGNVCRKFALHCFVLYTLKNRSLLTSCALWFVLLNASSHLCFRIFWPTSANQNFSIFQGTGLNQTSDAEPAFCVLSYRANYPPKWWNRLQTPYLSWERVTNRMSDLARDGSAAAPCRVAVTVHVSRASSQSGQINGLATTKLPKGLLIIIIIIRINIPKAPRLRMSPN